MPKKLSVLLIALFLLINAPSALALNAPIIDPIKSPVDATKQKITGTTEPNAKIIVTGGPYEIAPITADKNGHFEIIVALVEESTNLFSITAEKNGQISQSTKIEIVENAEQAAIAATSGTDNIAPTAPIVTETTQGSSNTYLITGTAEKDSTIEVSGTISGTTKTSIDGAFSIQVNLKAGQKNRLTLVAIDASDNISVATQIIIEAAKAETSSETIARTDVSEPFTDTKGHWAEPYVETLRLEGIIGGYSDGTFRPDTAITRAELTKIALTAFAIDIDENALSDFSDVEQGVWYAPYIASAQKKSIISGYSDGTFRPNQTINRAEALKILLEASGILKEPSLPELLSQGKSVSFSDTVENNWYFEYVEKSTILEIVNGYNDGTFGPGRSITRGETAKITQKIRALRSEAEQSSSLIQATEAISMPVLQKAMPNEIASSVA